MRDSLEQRKPQLRKHSAIRDFHPTISYYAPEEVDQLLAELAQLRARVAILDAQEAKLPELDQDVKDKWTALSPNARVGEVQDLFNVHKACRERQLLDALRATQAQNGIIRDLAEGIVEEYSPCVIDESRPRLEWCVTHQTKHCGQKALYEKAIAAYDALAGNGE